VHFGGEKVFDVKCHYSKRQSENSYRNSVYICQWDTLTMWLEWD